MMASFMGGLPISDATSVDTASEMTGRAVAQKPDSSENLWLGAEHG